ncbi:MAG: dNTP triphosphohydrolase [Fimbriimonadaceae bacterium]
MPHHIRELTEQREMVMLSPFAAKSAESQGREAQEEPDPVRTCFQRDRDRILHSKSFRRLKHKTQVFIAPVGDHFRTRMTHTLEVAQVARTIGRALRLNEDLIEAIALGHDVGHTPFGHAGEEALDGAIRSLSPPPTPSPSAGTNHPENGEGAPDPQYPKPNTQHPPQGFHHYEQSLRIVDILEKLNLTHETRAGIGGHSKGRKDLEDADGEPTSTLEAAVVRISDRIAYLNHDLDDALRSRIIESIPKRFEQIGPSHGKRIGAMVEDVILQSLDKPAIRLSPPMLDAMNEMKEWLYDHVYLRYPVLFPDTLKAQEAVRELFRHFCEPGKLPEGYAGIQGAIDYVAGMTDRFAIAAYARLKLPAAFRASDG